MNRRLVTSFMDFVRIDSESGNEQSFISKLREIIEEDLSGQCEIDDYGNLLARIAAKDCGSTVRIVLSNHADTVKPGSGIDPILENDMIRSRGDTVLGGDDKAGIAEVLEALRSAKRHPEVEWVVTREEELGLVGAKRFDVSRLEANMGFLIDSSEIDTIIVGGPSHMVMDVEIRGKGAHAGMEPEKGISAIQAASYSISRMKLGRLDKESTANVGTMTAGTVRNAIPESALILAECRSLDHEKCLRQARAMKDLFDKGAEAYGASATVKMEMSYRAMRIPEDAPPVVLAKQAMERCGLTPKTRMITGGTDASIFNEKGVQMAILGMGTRREHTVEEHVHVGDMEKVVEVLNTVFEELCR